MKTKSFLFCLIILASSINLKANDFQQGGAIISTTGVKNAEISLNGVWKFNLSPPASFWENGITTQNWADIKVPGECTLQGFKIEHDKEYPFKRQIEIPADFKDKQILLRFDGVYSFARVWVNGHFIRSHSGGFTSWYCDITPYVKPGEKAWLTVGITDRPDEISDGSGYAFHLIGGFLRGAAMLALPKNHISKFTVETDFDKAFQDAVLKVNISMNLDPASKPKVKFTLLSPDGKVVALNSASIEINGKNPSGQLHISVKTPLKWNAEQPFLYTLEAEVSLDDKVVQKISKKIGFRKIEVIGNKLFVNGTIVKMHGTCRHDAHPLLGRSTTNELDLQDVLLCKEANINYIRTSHYPPSQFFLEMCDKYGIYVEEETAACFVSSGPRESDQYNKFSKTQNDTAFSARYVGQFSEMIERDRDHPSVIIWSLGNESIYGTNFQKEYDYAKKSDLTRPVMFSWPMSSVGHKCFDVMSMHYPNTTGDGDCCSPNYNYPVKNFHTDTIPVLNDEYAHLPCYLFSSLKNDQNIRNAWGESVKKFWDVMYSTDGSLGGAVWCMTDDIFMLPDTAVGYGQWGFIDGWRRKKPEFWHLKKAYSPVIIENEIFQTNISSQNISITNRHDFTNLNALKVVFRKGNEKVEQAMPDVAPHAKGSLELPFSNLKTDDTINVSFIYNKQVVDEYNLTSGRTRIEFKSNQLKGISLKDDKDQYAVIGKEFSLIINKLSGKIISGIFKNEKLISGGPYLFLGNRFPGDGGVNDSYTKDYRILKEEDWKMGSISAKTIADTVFVEVSGAYDTLKIGYVFKISSDGLIRTAYHLNKLPKLSNSLGLCFDLSSDFNKIAWRRNGLWSAYPADHIGRLSGVAVKNPENAHHYKVKPSHAWSADTKDFFLNGKNGINKSLGLATIDYRTMKEHIFYYTLMNDPKGVNLRVEGGGKDIAARCEPQTNGSSKLFLLNHWWYPEMAWQNYCGDFKPDLKKDLSVTMRFISGK